MRLTGLTEAQKSSIVLFLKNELLAYCVILFGSAAKETLRPDSDVDIAFLSDKLHSPYDLFMSAQRLAELLGREVDLVDFRQASSVFKAQIVGTGIVLLDDEPIKRQYAFMQALKEYAMLNEERHDLLEKQGIALGGVIDDERYSLEQNRNDPSLHSENPGGV